MTKISDDDGENLLAKLTHIGVTIHCRKSRETFQFENIYPSSDPNLRLQNISGLADPFTTNDLDDVLADAFHLGPLAAGDIETPLFAELATRGTVALDVQGLLRIRQLGQVALRMAPTIRNLIQHAHILKADIEEARLLTGCNSIQGALTELQSWGPTEILITDGSRGSSVYSPEGMWKIPAYPPTDAVDPTGCGDTYLAGDVTARLKGFSPYKSAHIGAVAASHKLECANPLQSSFDELSKKIPRDNNLSITNVVDRN